MVIWFTGLSAAGKSTLCDALRQVLSPYLPAVVVLEGEDLRAALGNDLGHSTEDRLTALSRLQGIAHLLSKQNVPLIAACVYMPDSAREWNRRNLEGYFDVHLDVVLETVTRRDPKGIYKEALSGDRKNVMGVDIPYEPPVSPSLLVSNNGEMTPEALALKIALGAPPVLARLSAEDQAELNRRFAELTGHLEAKG